MLFGPIVHAEMVRIARQRRWYVLRFGLGLGLLLVCQQGYESFVGGRSPQVRVLPELVMRATATRVMVTFVAAQSFAVMLLAPILVAGLIAEEKQRKTLHYLLSSRLSSLEIVGGKLAARLLLILVPVAIALPIMVLLALLGGVELPVLALVYAATLTTALFEASLAILVSTLMRRAREALLLMILAGIAWFIGPYLLKNVLLDGGERAVAFHERWVQPWNDHLLALGPLSIPTRAWAWAQAVSAIARMMGHQVVASALLLGLATWQLRPAFRRQEGGGKRRLSAARALSALRYGRRPRPACGDDPMIWKETHGLTGASLTGLISLATIVTVSVALYQPIKEVVPRAWLELKAHGYRIDRNDYSRQELSTALSGAATGIFCIWTLVLMIQSATSISREREEDTWISLVATPLSGREILRAKMLGSFWATRHLVYGIMAFWAFGLVMGSLHPAGLAISAVQLAGFGLAIVAAGTLLSMVTTSTARALGAGVLGLLGVSVIFPTLYEAASGIHGRAQVAATSPPFLFAMGMINYVNFRALTHPSEWFPQPDDRRTFLIGTASIVLGSLAYVAAGPVLVAVAARRFDRLLDRPRRRIVKERKAEPTAPGPAGAARAGLPEGRA